MSIKPWSPGEIEILRKSFVYGCACAARALPARTEYAIRSKANELRILAKIKTPTPLTWSTQEIEILAGLYESAPMAQVVAALPGRTANSCQAMGRKIGLRRSRKAWAAEQANARAHLPACGGDPFDEPKRRLLSDWKLDHKIGARSVFDLAGAACES